MYKSIVIIISIFIMSCSATSQYKDINDTLYKSMRDGLLEKYKGNILTPKNVKEINLNSLPKHFSFILSDYENGKKDIHNSEYLHKYESINDGKHQFTSTFSSEKYPTEIKHYYIKGNQTIYTKSGRNYGAGLSRCSFVVGKCNFTLYPSLKVLEAKTSFKKGLWITQYKTSLGAVIQQVAVYDKFGLPIYKYSISSLTKEPIVMVRK